LDRQNLDKTRENPEIEDRQTGAFGPINPGYRSARLGLFALQHDEIENCRGTQLLK
jgi:hypothetical protein